jgi:hypothetical protein
MSDNSEGSRKRDRHRRHRSHGDGREGQAREIQTKDNSGRDSVSRESRSHVVPSRDAPVGRENLPRESRRERREETIPLPKLPTPVCSRCSQPIQDITSALADKGTGEPVHFDCVLSFLQGAENLAANEKIIYIGQGRFAVMPFENPADTRKFKIIRTIEWENREEKSEWRADISGRFSQIK